MVRAGIGTAALLLLTIPLITVAADARGGFGGGHGGGFGGGAYRRVRRRDVPGASAAATSVDLGVAASAASAAASAGGALSGARAASGLGAREAWELEVIPPAARASAASAERHVSAE
jgi:hypothetical protein